MTPDKVLIQKANDLILNDLSTSGGIMSPATQQKFFVRTIKESVALKMFDVRTTKSFQENLPAFKLTDRVLQAGQEKVALTDAQSFKPTLSQPQLNVKLFRGNVPISDEALEDNVERKSLVQTLLRELPAAISRDMEEVVFQGDTTAIVAGDAARQLFLRSFNGLIAQTATSTASGGGTVFSIDQLEALRQSMGVEYTAPEKWLKTAIFVPVQAYHTWADAYAHRMTPGGDSLYIKNGAQFIPAYNGAPIIGVPMMPVAAATNYGTAICTNPKNVVVGLWRKVTIEVWRDYSAGMNYIAISLRMDCTYQDEAASAKLTTFKVS